MADIPGIAETTLKVKEMSLGDKVKNTQDRSESRVNENNKEIILSSVTNSGDFDGFDVCTDFTFDNVIGHLEDMLIDEGFHALQNRFLENYWQEFSDNEENKHSYMIIFNEYTNKIEDFIVDYLKERIPNFDMNTFALELERRKDTLEGEIFEVLLTLSDFSAFKEIFLDYRAVRNVSSPDTQLETLCEFCHFGHFWMFTVWLLCFSIQICGRIREFSSTSSRRFPLVESSIQPPQWVDS